MSRYKILIADDDPVMSATLSGVLAAQGYALVIARDAMQVVMFALKDQPDVILLDINMPAGTGLGALKRLKASTRTASIPILVLSGATAPDLGALVRAQGAMDFLPKPVDLDALCSRLAALLAPPSQANGSPHAPS
jgi:DNA-binding response OmpR family regulator